MKTVPERLQALRNIMKRENLSAYIVYSGDAHGSEYVAAHWRSRTWLSGFTGSAGILVVTAEEAGLWTDFRYYIQAAQELEGSGISLFKAGVPGVPEYREWLSGKLPAGSVVGMDGRTLTVKEWESLAGRFNPAGLSISVRKDLVGEIWADRPEVPCVPVWQLTPEESGESREARLKRVREEMRRSGVDNYLISSLDDIAWLLNIRGADVAYNPVVQSYLLLNGSGVFWFVRTDAVSSGIRGDLERDGVTVREYDEVISMVSGLPAESVLLVSAEKTSSLLVGSVPEGVKILKAMDITTRMKAQKNPVEQGQIRKAMEKDGAAMVRFLIWMEKALKERKVTELEAAAALRGFRAEQEGFLDESFSPIPGYRSHGALCHYEADEEGQFAMEPSGLFLLDSGGQYREGTTDITRTIALGEPTDEEVRDYTLVLKGHVALSMVHFPRGTRGYQLDALARLPLWEQGLNFGHGTGHGVGYILNVHEGPQRISPHPVDEELKPGMVSSNEPGIYREGSHGVRIENLILTVPWEECPGDGEFYGFETLTLCPYDHSLIDPALLTAEEKGWINGYQEEVRRRLAPLLSESENNWLEAAACEIK